MDAKEHWERVYADKAPHTVSWYEPRPDLSLTLIDNANLALEDPILDVGGGVSSLVDELLETGYTDVSVLDVSSRALDIGRQRLGSNAGRVRWIQADILDFEPERVYQLWHDRALMHFLTTPSDQRKYVELLTASLAPAGQAVLSTFGPDGPQRCSGLPVQRYSAESLDALLGAGFALVEQLPALHTTPTGAVQRFVYTRFQRI